MPDDSDAPHLSAAHGPDGFPSGEVRNLGLGGTAGLAVVAMGLGLSASGLFQLGTRVGLGTVLDDRVFAAVGLGLVALGAVLFGPLARARGTASWALASAAAAGLCILSLAVVAAITSPLGFKGHCLRFGTDASLAGTPFVDAVSALVMFILPGFGIGAVLGARRRWQEVATIAGSLAVGWSLRTQAYGLMESFDWKNAGAAGLVFYGALVVSLGLMVSGRTMQAGSVRLTFGGLALAALVAAVPISPITVYHPWQRFPVKPLDVFETVNGQYTVQPAGPSGLQVLLNQRPLSPGASELTLEAACLQRTVEAWQESDLPWPPARTLVVGLVTPERADLLSAFGLDRIDRTAAWYDDLARVEERLWQGTPPPGERIAPNDLEAAAPYDLVFAFPAGTYRSAGWDLALVREVHAAVKTVWLPGDMGPQVDWEGSKLALASRGIEQFGFGYFEGVPKSFGAATAVARPISMAWMGTRPEARPFTTLQEVAGDVDKVLAEHAAVQRISSPFEGPLEQVEIAPAALDGWRARALASEAAPDLFLTGVLEGSAAVLMAQGEVQRLRALVEPLAERFPDWVGLQVAWAWSESQELDFQAASERLRPLALADPDRRDLQIALAEALVELGDPEGRKIAQGLLRDDPQNPRLFGLARGVRGMDSVGQPGGYESLTQEEATSLADGAVLGIITGISVQEVDAEDGAPLFLTTLTVSGTKLASPTLPGAPRFEEEAEHQVTFLGGFTDPEHGTFNSTAPPAHATRIGRRVLYYYQSQDDIAGGVAGHALLRGGAGLFTAFETPNRTDASAPPTVIVQGRGNTAAIPYNLVRDELIAPH